VNNRYLVAWYEKDLRVASERWDLYGQLVSAGGTSAGESFLIQPSALIFQPAPPALAYNPQDNQYLVTWTDDRLGGEGRVNIFGRKISHNGVLIGGDFPVTSGPNGQRYPSTVYNSLANEYLVLWEDSRNMDSGSAIYGQRVR